MVIPPIVSTVARAQRRDLRLGGCIEDVLPLAALALTGEGRRKPFHHSPSTILEMMPFWISLLPP